MVGAVSVVGSSLADSKTCPSLKCLDAMPSCNINCADLNLQKHSIGIKQVTRISSFELSSSFLDVSAVKALSCSKNPMIQKKNKKVAIVNELVGEYEDNFEDVKKQILNYFTYKAVRTVLNQLYELNPTQYRWFYDHVANNEHGYGKRFIRNLQKEKHELAERVMVTRLHLYGKWVKRYDHSEMYERISDQNLELMRERLIETVVWPSDDMNTDGV